MVRIEKIALFVVVEMLLLCLAGCLGPQSSPKELSDELNIFNWEDYFGETTLEDFEQQFGVKVNLYTFEDEEYMMSALESNPGRYDLAVTSDCTVSELMATRSLAEIDKENILLKADKLRLQEVLNNLLINAIKYTPENVGTIVIHAEKEKDEIILSMTDSGIGMTEEEIDHISEEFYKADFARHDLDSHGLGLAICKRIIEMHGGKIWATSQGLGKGSTFYFTLKEGTTIPSYTIELK